MRFLILGPVRVATGAGDPWSGGPRESRVLATLLLAANEVVALADLVDHVWDDRPPRTARRQIHNCVWSLRRQVDIVADGPGYRMPVDAGSLDADRFAAGVGAAHVAASTGRLEEAVERLRSALAVWRGPALAGCGGRLLQLRADRLNEQRLTAVQQCIDLELRLGRAVSLVAELTELVGSHPLRERLVAQLMRALHGSGRRAEALAAYQSLRARLADELGIDPAAELERLHIGILRDSLPAIPEPAGGRPDALLAAIDFAASTELDRETWQLAWTLANVGDPR